MYSIQLLISIAIFALPVRVSISCANYQDANKCQSIIVVNVQIIPLMENKLLYTVTPLNQSSGTVCVKCLTHIL